jgi:hypothetical protein
MGLANEKLQAWDDLKRVLNGRDSRYYEQCITILVQQNQSPPPWLLEPFMKKKDVLIRIFLANGLKTESGKYAVEYINEVAVRHECTSNSRYISANVVDQCLKMCDQSLVKSIKKSLAEYEAQLLSVSK